MLYVKVPKDINEYKEKVFLGMTSKQLKWLICGILSALLFYFLTIVLLHLPQDIGLYGGALIALFCFACGWYDIKGVPFDEYLMIKFRYRTKQQLLEYDNESFQQKGEMRKHDKKKSRKERRKNKKINKGIKEEDE